MYHIAICDDDLAFIRYIRRLFECSKWKDEELVFSEYYSGEELIADLCNKERCDLLILDLRLEGMDGHETAKAFRRQFPDSILIFCSGVCLPTVESFETTPYRYWLKEYTEAHLIEEMDSVWEKARKEIKVPVLMGIAGSKIVKIRAEDVLYIEIVKHGSTIHCMDKSYFSKQRVSQYYDVLKDFEFAYAHNSYIVNLNYVVMVDVTELELVNGQKLSVSRSKGKTFRKAFVSNLAQKY